MQPSGPSPTLFFIIYLFGLILKNFPELGTNMIRMKQIQAFQEQS